MSCALVYSDPKSTLWRKNLQFSHFYVNDVFSVNITIYINSSFVIFLPLKIWNKHLSKIGNFSKLKKFSVLFRRPNRPKNIKSTRFVWVFIVLGIYNLAHPSFSFHPSLPSTQGVPFGLLLFTNLWLKEKKDWNGLGLVTILLTQLKSTNIH